jgi:hypothetical protein
MLRSSLDQQWGLAASLDRSFKHRRKVLAIHICGGDRSKSGMLVGQCLDGCSHSSRHWLLPTVIDALEKSERVSPGASSTASPSSIGLYSISGKSLIGISSIFYFDRFDRIDKIDREKSYNNRICIKTFSHSLCYQTYQNIISFHSLASHPNLRSLA